MVFSDGTPKGMKAVLIERGINVTKMKADEMRTTLQNMHDFKYETSIDVLPSKNQAPCKYCTLASKLKHC